MCDSDDNAATDAAVTAHHSCYIQRVAIIEASLAAEKGPPTNPEAIALATQTPGCPEEQTAAEAIAERVVDATRRAGFSLYGQHTPIPVRWGKANPNTASMHRCQNAS